MRHYMFAGSAKDLASFREVDRILEGLKLATGLWRYSAVSERVRRLRKLRKAVLELEKDIVAALTDDNEMDKPVLEAYSDEIGIVLDVIRYCIKEGPRLIEPGVRVPFAKKFVMLPGREARLRYVPKGSGIVALITPFNMPFQIPVGDMAEALMSGCVVVIKPSELTPKVNAVIRKLISRAGLDDIVAFIEGDSDMGRVVLEYGLPKDSEVFFTGSKTVAMRVEEICRRRGLHFHCEPGGVDHMIVLVDSIKRGKLYRRAVNAAVSGRFRNKGRACNGVKIVDLVTDNESDAVGFAGWVAEEASRLKPFRDYGRDLVPEQVYALKEQLEAAVRNGARVMNPVSFLKGMKLPLSGDEFRLVPFPPVVLYCDENTPVDLNCEMFGPVLILRHVRKANELVRTETLDTYIFGEEAEALALAERLDIYAGCINDVQVNYAYPELPFGATGISTGRHGPGGILKYTRPQPIVIARPMFGFWAVTENHWPPYDGNIKFLGISLPIAKAKALRDAIKKFL